MWLSISYDILPHSGILLVTTVTLIFIYYKFKLRSGGRLPPGPRGLPLLGVAPFLDKNPFVSFSKWAEEYGPIMRVSVMGEEMIILNDVDVMREALMKDVFSGRPQNVLTRDIAKNSGVVSTEGPLWREHRRFDMSTLRDFGMGKLALEQSIMDEVTDMVTAVAEKDGKPCDLYYLISISVFNIIAAMLFGKRYQHDDPKLHLHIRLISENMKNLGTLNMSLSRFPWLKYLPGDVFKYWQTVDNADVIIKGLQEEIDQHKATYKPEITRDFIDAYLHKEKGDGHKNSTFTNEQLLITLFDMFVAGMDTTATTIRWTLLFLIHHPEIQDRIHEEIDREVGRDNLPAMSQRSNLRFLEATINEVLRRSLMGPGALPHACREDITLAGFHIPKNTVIIPNIYRVHMDPKNWPDPEVFSPDRFMDADGNVTKPRALIPFSVGKRACLGESLARMELYLFLAGLLQKFRFLPEDEDNLPSTEGVFAIVVAPAPFKVRAVKRI